MDRLRGRTARPVWSGVRRTGRPGSAPRTHALRWPVRVGRRERRKSFPRGARAKRAQSAPSGPWKFGHHADSVGRFR